MVKEKEIKATKLLKETIKAVEDEFFIILHEGGSRSGKTTAIAQYFMLRGLQGHKERVTIIRDKLTILKATALQDFSDVVDRVGIKLSPPVNPNRPDQTYTIGQMSYSFLGFDQADGVERAHGKGQEWTWINEGLFLSEKVFNQIAQRTSKGIIIDYNPAVDKHWIYDLVAREDCILIHSTMLDNPFLPENIIRQIKGYEPTPENIARKTADKYLWEVYGLGLRAKLEGVVFDHYEEIDEIPPQKEFVAYGMDFGYSIDPTTLIAVYRSDNDLYLDQVMWDVGLTNQDIIARLKALGITQTDEIIADSAEPKSIEEIRRAGFRIVGAEKGTDSIRFGIDILKSFNLHITKRSVDLKTEFNNYKWAEDRTGKILPYPIEEFNHGIDATRYVALNKLKRFHSVSVRDRSQLPL